jgi:hypothetical protein
MSTNIDLAFSNTGKKHMVVSLFLLGGLLFLRFPFVVTTQILLTNEPALGFMVLVIFSGGTYLLTAILIWWERERLQDFWIDIASAITFLCQIPWFPIGIGLFRAMRRSHAKFPNPPTGMWRWLLVGAILALVSGIVTMSLVVKPTDSRSGTPANLIFLVPAILTQMTTAAVWEEPLFRGFLWGYLRRWRWPNVLIWLFQAALFASGHIYYLKEEAFVPWLIRMMLPALLTGLIAWQARSIFASMVTHGVFNASWDMLIHTRSLSEAIQVSWSVVVILTGILAAVWILEWLRHRRASAICR